MKPLLGILSALTLSLALTLPAAAQNLAIGERTPSMHIGYRHWMNGYVPPEREFNYIGFVHSASLLCVRGTEHAERIIAANGKIRMLIFTKESAAETGAWLGRYAAGNSGVACEREYTFRSFGVNYAPFGVITDSKRRVLWFGNPKQLTEEFLQKLTDTEKTKWRSRR